MTTLEPAAGFSGELEAAHARSYLGGFLVFLISETMFFVPMFASRFVLAGSGHPAALDQGLAVVVTALMAISLVPAIAMHRAAGEASWERVQHLALTTAAAGVLLLGALVWEWWGFDISPQSRFGGIYYLTVGMHAVHVLFAVLFLVGVAARARAGRFTRGSHVAVRAAQMFWILVAALWGVVWVVFYLV